MKQTIVMRAEIFQEGHLYLGVCPDLHVSSFGETIEGAKSALREALEAFLEECEAMGTLAGRSWKRRVSSRRMGIGWLANPSRPNWLPLAKPRQ